MGKGIYEAFSLHAIHFRQLSRSFVEHAEQVGLPRANCPLLLFIHDILLPTTSYPTSAPKLQQSGMNLN
jgi:hypothetical protein